MKKAPILIAGSIGLTVLLYMLAYYFLPPPPPNAAMVLLFAAVAMIATWGIDAAIKKYRARRAGTSGPGSSSTGTHVVLAFLLLGALSPLALAVAIKGSVFASEAAQTPQHSSQVALSTVCKFTSGPRTGATQDYSDLTPAPIGSPCTDGEGSKGTVIARDPFQNGIFQPSPSHGHGEGRHGEGQHGEGQHGSFGKGDSAKGSSQPSSRGHGGPTLGTPVGQGAPSPGPAVGGESPAPAPAPTAAPAPVGQTPANELTIGGFTKRNPPPGGGLRRVTGTAILLAGQKEESGYALYSYALMSHHPQAAELPKIKAYLTALLGLPTAAAVEQNVPRGRINITYLPLETPAPTWNILSTENKVNYVVEHYDYARGATMVASLDQLTGPGPVIISLLGPLDLSAHPHPVLLQDLTTAEPSLMASYVTYFVNQTATDQFQKDKTLSNFSLTLRNGLEVAANAVGMSKDAVATWVKYFE